MQLISFGISSRASCQTERSRNPVSVDEISAKGPEDSIDKMDVIAVRRLATDETAHIKEMINWPLNPGLR
jgi:hypothetical protein